MVFTRFSALVGSLFLRLVFVVNLLVAVTHAQAPLLALEQRQTSLDFASPIASSHGQGFVASISQPNVSPAPSSPSSSSISSSSSSSSSSTTPSSASSGSTASSSRPSPSHSHSQIPSPTPSGGTGNSSSHSSKHTSGSSKSSTTHRSTSHSPQSTHKHSSSTTAKSSHTTKNSIHRTTSPLVGTFTGPHKITVTSTDSRGSSTVRVVTTVGVFASTTGHVTATSGADLQPGGSGGSGGLSDSSKKIVGGVVGGIGGAILVGALAIFAWRRWGKNRHRDDNGDLIDYAAYSPQGYMTRESKPPSRGSTQALSEPLDRYNRPAAVTPSSNF